MRNSMATAVVVGLILLVAGAAVAGTPRSAASPAVDPPAPFALWDPATDATPAAAPFDLGQTFDLESLPGANHVIYLDFDGHTTSGTSWNNTYNSGDPFFTPAYDPGNNGSTFSNFERERIQRIWQRVTEDFSPFNVNVTTHDPGVDRLRDSGGSDNYWGVRLVIGGSSDDWFDEPGSDGKDPGDAGGVAYVGSFDWGSDTPAFAFEDQLGGGSEKSTAEAISHEAGHTLGLHHDGTVAHGAVDADEYFAGHGSGANGWAPIMGVGYYRQLTQWSEGEYRYADEDQDDLATITTGNGFGYRPDDHGEGSPQATLLTTTITGGTRAQVSGEGVITTRDDADWFGFDHGGGLAAINILPFERGANLDIIARLYNAFGRLLFTSNPLEDLNASFVENLAAGRYYLSIDGTGFGDPLTNGYSDYGSLGQYLISGSIVTIPEPATAVLLALAAAGLVRRRHPRSSRVGQGP